ncbi:hypothetical protein ACXJY6_01215 [Vibrio sp. RC27]
MKKIMQICINRLSFFLFITCTLLSGTSYAEKKYTPSDVYANIDYASRLLVKVLEEKNITDIALPKSHETAVKPMHVYELNVATIAEIYQYTLENKLTPPPLTFSSPINYSPTDVYYLTQIVTDAIERIYENNVGVNVYNVERFSNKSPKDVYDKLFKLYAKVLRLRGYDKVSPNQVYAQTYRAKTDLKSIISTLSNRLDDLNFDQKRLLVTAAYGMHPDGSKMEAYEKDKTPKDVVISALSVRKKINQLKEIYKMETLAIPQENSFSKVTPSDAFLQTQYIIAEINLLKKPLNISNSTDIAIEVKNKKPSDVYQEMKHINYLLDRLIDQKGASL